MNHKTFATTLVALATLVLGLPPSVHAADPFNAAHAAIPAIDDVEVVDSLDHWILGYGIDAPCEAVSFCQTCINTCIVACLDNGGQALSTCRVTSSDCTCICECKRPTLGIQVN
jgi:hypothetical protein